jgi:cytidylate kinase
MKILVMGLPGAGKTTLATALAKEMKAVHFNADRVRETMNKDLGFSVADRIEQARRMGWMCQYVKESGHIAIADFVCPTLETRKAFNADLIIWMHTIPEGRFNDTNNLFEQPGLPDLVIRDFNYDIKQIAICLQIFYNGV